MRSHPFFDQLRLLDLPGDDYAVFASGPMFAHGIRDDLGDLDLIVRGSALERVKEIGQEEKTERGDIYYKVSDDIDAFPSWYPGDWDIDQLIDQAETIDGIRFVDLETVLDWKRKMARPKDQQHIMMIEEYLNK